MPSEDTYFTPESASEAGKKGGAKSRRGKSIKSILLKYLEQENPEGENGETYQESLALTLIRKAIVDGDMQAVKEIHDRLEGKASQHIEQDITERKSTEKIEVIIVEEPKKD